MIDMMAMHEQRVSHLADRLGLQLTRAPARSSTLLYRLVDPDTAMPVFPGGNGEGAPLGDLEDWLRFPWE